MPETFTDAERAALAPYVTNLDASVFALRGLPEEVVAVLFAYYSRSPHSLRRNLLRLLAEGDLDLAEADAPAPPDQTHLDAAREKARAFHEKWVVGYGHASVAEHGCVHLALEDVSIIASKLIEDARLASYTEKSTRYVAFDPSKIYYPPGIMTRPTLADAYSRAIRALLNAYVDWTDDFVAQIKRIAPVPRSKANAVTTPPPARLRSTPCVIYCPPRHIPILASPSMPARWKVSSPNYYLSP